MRLYGGKNLNEAGVLKIEVYHTRRYLGFGHPSNPMSGMGVGNY